MCQGRKKKGRVLANPPLPGSPDLIPVSRLILPFHSSETSRYVLRHDGADQLTTSWFLTKPLVCLQ